MLYFIILSGTGEGYLETFVSQNEPCPNCASMDSLELNFYQKYYRLYYVPTFPLRKTGNVLCNNCGFKAFIKDCNPGIKSEFELYKKELKTPLWTWIGLAIIFSLLSLIFYSVVRTPKEEKFEKIELGNVYVYPSEEILNISTRRVIDIKGDSVWIKEEVTGDTKESQQTNFPFQNKDTLVFSLDDFKQDLKKNRAFEMNKN